MLKEVRFRLSGRFGLALCALGLAWGATGCSKAGDETALEAGPGGGLGGFGGSGASGGAGGSTAGTAANAGRGGSLAQVDDAGTDATADATGAVDLCEPGLLTTYCANSPCPAFDAARQALRDSMGFLTPVAAIVQRSCTAPDGSARVSVGADYRSWTRTFIYDAETHQLTGVVLSNDLGIRCDGDDSLSGRHGERSPDCEWRDPVPSGCETSDAGSSDAGSSDAGLGGPLGCVLTP